MLDSAKIMMKDSGVKDHVFWDRMSEVVKRAQSRGERFDMTIASFTLTELPSDAARVAAVQLLYELLDVGGMLVLIENGNPQGSHTVRTARQFILDTYGADASSSLNKLTAKRKSSPSSSESTKAKMRKLVGMDEEQEAVDYDGNGVVKVTMDKVLPPPLGYAHEDLAARTIAPCSHDRPCPLDAGVWCSFSQKVQSGVMRRGHEEKFSYVIIQKVPLAKAKPSAEIDLWVSDSPHKKSPQSGDDPTPLTVLDRFFETPESKIDDLVEKLLEEVDWYEYNPPLYRHEWARVVRY